MANSLGTVSIDVLANISSMVSDLGKAQAETAKATRGMQRQWQSMGEGIRESITSIGAALGVGFSVDRIVELTRASLEAAEQVENLAQTIGASTQTIQTLGFAAELTGKSADVMTGALTKLERSANQAASGNKQMIAAFEAIGISATQAGQLLKNPDQLIQVVTQHLAAFGNAGGKVPVVLQLMGRGAAENIPIINKLGTEYAQLTERAKEIGVVLSEQDTKALAAANEGLDEIGQQVKGLANEFTIALLPAITAASEGLSEFLASPEIKTDIQAFGSGLDNVVTHLGDIKDLAGSIVAFGLPTFFGDAAREAGNLASQSGIVYDVFAKIRDILPSLNFDWISRAKQGIQNLGVDVFSNVAKTWEEIKTDASAAGVVVSGVLGGFSGKLSDLDSQLAANETAWKKNSTSIDEAASLAKSGIASASAAVDEFGLHLRDSGKEADAANKPLINYNANVAGTGKEAQKVANDLLSMQQTLDKIAGKTGGEYYKAWIEYQGGLTEVDKAAQKYTADGVPLQKVQEFVAKATQELTENFDAQVQAMRNANDADAILSLSRAKAETDLNEQIRLLGMDEQSREADALATKLITAALGDLKSFMGPLTEDQQKLVDSNNALAKTFTTEKTQLDLAKQAAQEYVGIWKQAGDSLANTFASILVNGGSLFDSLVNLAKQTVQQIIAYFVKLAVINPILNAIFGGSAGFSLLPTLGGAAVSGVGGVAGFGSAATTTGSSSLFTAGETMWAGFEKGFSASGVASSNMFGTYTPDYGTGTYAPSGLGYGLAAAGGIYAGYSEFNRAGGGAAGALGGAAYGYGTFAASIGTSAALSGGLAAGVAAIPIVGWIAIAAMLVDMFSGGKLFGTKGKMQEGSTTLVVGPGGADFANQISLKGQKPLFGGAKWSTQDIAETPEQKAAAMAFFDSMTKTMTQYAKQFGVKAGDLVSASFQQVFDKKGNLTGKTEANIAGYSYSNLTQDQFSQAYVAANELTVLDQFDSKLEATIADFRKSADTLVAIANGLTEAEGYLQSGGDFIAIAGKDTLSAIVTLATGMQGAGETIDQTIDRLIKAQQQYDQFVGQFKPAATYVDDFEASLSSINTQMLANIKQANALAVAAGAAGASEQDLANIHSYAAHQMAQAIAQLESSAQSLAFGLGLTNTGSLDEVNAEIQRLQAKANQGSSAVSGFGNAMQTAAQKASDAINLLIGDLSPLNDQQKLQTALAGLRAGTVTQDQVLQIGRRLYASSQAYTDLFNQVMTIGGGRGTGAQTGGGGRSGGGLTGAESSRLQQLLKEQQQLQAAAQLQQYQTLAQQIAEISSAKGEDWQQVVSDMGIDLKAFEKGLGMNDSQLDAYIKNFQALKDSNGDNTKSIVDVLNQILTALGGTPSASPDQAPTALGHTTHSGTRGDDGVRQAIIDGFRTVGLQAPRNQRTRVTIGGA